MEENQIRIALDIMGGDNAPECNLLGAKDALQKNAEIKLILIGPEELIRQKVSELELPVSRVEVMDATEVISPEESPVAALKAKKNSSIVVGSHLVKEGTADALVSAGSSGALLAAGQLIIGRIRGVQRPPLGTLIPTEKGTSFFLDLGANVDARPEWLHQFALMGTAYMEAVEHKTKPTLKLISLGLEEEKGSSLTKEVNQLLKNEPKINYLGYAEAREVPYGAADIVVTDAFTGNAMLKMFEGTGGLLLKTLKQTLKEGSFTTKLGALLIKKDLKEAMRPYDISAYGGAPLLGIRGILVKCHGNATRKEICNGILQAAEMKQTGVNERIAKKLELDYNEKNT